MTNKKVEQLKGKLIVSCQALPHEPLHSSFIMGRMALAAKEGGAYGIRANTKEDIKEIQSQVDLPIIGIVKRDYEGSNVYITPTLLEVEELMDDLRRVGCHILTIGQYLQPTHKHYPVAAYITPEQFALYREKGLEKGFQQVESAPLVRSSYHAEKQIHFIQKRSKIGNI